MRRRVGFARDQRVEAALDVRRQHLERADIQFLGGLFDAGGIDAERHRCKFPIRYRARTAAHSTSAPRRASAIASSATRRASPTNSTNSNRTPPARCAASASTSSVSANLTAGWRVHARKSFERRRPRERLRQRRRNAGQEQRQRDARHAVHDERPVRRMAARPRIVATNAVGSRRHCGGSHAGMADGLIPRQRQRPHGVQSAAEQHQREQREHRVGARPRSASHSSAIVRSPSGAWIGDRDDEDHVKSRPRRIGMHAPDHRLRREAVAHRVDDRRQMHDDAHARAPRPMRAAARSATQPRERPWRRDSRRLAIAGAVPVPLTAVPSRQRAQPVASARQSTPSA